MITFISRPLEDTVLNAFNNNVFVFESDTVLDATRCEITIDIDLGYDIILEITPINNIFYFNTKEILSLASFNNRFIDNTRPSLGFVSDGTFLKEASFNFDIYGSGTDTESLLIPFTRSVQQIAETNNKTGIYLLSKSELTFFKGYPFDFCINVPSPTFTNDSNKQFFYSTTVANQRLFLSDGQKIINNDSEFQKRVLALSGGFLVNGCQEDFGDFLRVGINQILVSNVSGEIEMTINLKDICDGVYLKWINEFGTWNYWLFSRIYKEEIMTSTQGIYNVDYLDISETKTVELSTGKKARETVKLNYQNLTNEEMQQVKSLFTSPRVELYNRVYGQNNDVSTFAEFWQTVQVKDGSTLIKQTKRNLINVSFDIEKNRYTQS